MAVVGRGPLILKPQDLVVALKLAVNHERDFVLTALAEELGMALSSVHGAVQRAEQARLVSRASGGVRAVLPAIAEFTIHGAKYAFPGRLGASARGMPTAIGGPVLSRHFEGFGESPVWPDPKGENRGPGLQPLYPGAPEAARRDLRLYEVLSLLDALRVGAARERELATEALKERLA